MKIKDLDKNKRYKLDGLSEDQISILYDWLCTHDIGWEDYGLERFIKLSHTNFSFQYYNVSGWSFVHPFPDDESIQKLFYEEEWKPKRGEKVLVRDAGDEKWIEREFITEYNNLYYVSPLIKEELVSFKQIKKLPTYEWYVIDRGLDKEFRQITEEDVLYYNAQEIFTQKITNESLIKTLEEYGNLEE